VSHKKKLSPYDPAEAQPVYISVDVETAGPFPADYALLSIGACLPVKPKHQFYVELQPDRFGWSPEALEVSGLSLEELSRSGTPPQKALEKFETWVKEITPEGARPVFVAFNAAFDWMFINDYFHRYLGRNPFGHSALDIKALFMGAQRVSWAETSFTKVSAHFGGSAHLQHNALQDALDQGVLFQRILEGLKVDE